MSTSKPALKMSDIIVKMWRRIRYNSRRIEFLEAQIISLRADLKSLSKTNAIGVFKSDDEVFGPVDRELRK